MKRRLLMGAAGVFLAMGLMAGSASAAGVATGTSGMANQVAPASNLVQDVTYGHHWRHRHHHHHFWRPWWYRQYYSYRYFDRDCGWRHRCWRDRNGYRDCGWVNTCRRDYYW
jgi:hypothetical protein